MIKITRGWPLKRRKEQAERIKKQKPWLKSTGPRTKKGKAIVAKNAWKHGFRSAAMKEIYQLLRWQRQFVKNIQAQTSINPYKELILPISYDKEHTLLILHNSV